MTSIEILIYIPAMHCGPLNNLKCVEMTLNPFYSIHTTTTYIKIIHVQYIKNMVSLDYNETFIFIPRFFQVRFSSGYLGAERVPAKTNERRQQVDGGDAEHEIRLAAKSCTVKHGLNMHVNAF